MNARVIVSPPLESFEYRKIGKIGDETWRKGSRSSDFAASLSFDSARKGEETRSFFSLFRSTRHGCRETRTEEETKWGSERYLWESRRPVVHAARGPGRIITPLRIKKAREREREGERISLNTFQDVESRAGRVEADTRNFVV